MGRRSKIQAAVEDFEIQFENLVQEYLDDIDMDKAVDYFHSATLYDAVVDVLEVDIEVDVEEDEDGEVE